MSMTRICNYILAIALFLYLLASGMAYGISEGEKVKISGLITSRTGESVTVKTASSDSVVVVLTNETRVAQPRGVFGFRKKEMGVTMLMPGLKVEIQGVGQANNRVVADTIKFSANDLQTAEAIQSGLAPTKQAVQTNKRSIGSNSGSIQSNAEQLSSNQVQLA